LLRTMSKPKRNNKLSPATREHPTATVVKSPKAKLLPPDLPTPERIDRENDLA